MFKFIFDLATEPLGLPIEWYYEWIILLVIGEIAYHVAYDKVGALYHSGSISGRAAGSFPSLSPFFLHNLTFYLSRFFSTFST